MFAEMTRILNFMVEAFLHVWPFVLVTIPIAVAVKATGASRYIERALKARPVTAIALATLVGAFSPFCSCTVIPVIASLLLGGVPLAPVMSFWIASPSMDPEIFFLSVATIGWELAWWRLGATLGMSLAAGFATHLAFRRGWLGEQVLRPAQRPRRGLRQVVRDAEQRLRSALFPLPRWRIAGAEAAAVAGCDEPVLCAASAAGETRPSAASGCGCGSGASPSAASVAETGLADEGAGNEATASSTAAGASASCGSQAVPFRSRLWRETKAATWMVGKFMALAFALEAVLILYVPAQWVTSTLGGENPLAILTAALVGIPVYTSSLAALPMIGGLLIQGMDPAAALAFLVAGPTTTIPAMAAVWGLVRRRVFALYVAYALLGAIAAGYVYTFAAML